MSVLEDRRQEIRNDRRELDGLTMRELRDMATRDQILPDRITLNGQDLSINEALRNRQFREQFATNLTTSHLSGRGDFSRQIALIQEYGERLDGMQRVTCISREFNNACTITGMDRGSLNNIAPPSAEPKVNHPPVATLGGVRG